MKPSLWHRLDALARRLTPFALTLILVVVGVVPLHITGLARVAPLLPLVAVYHWAIYRPRLLPAFAVFLIGLLQDPVSGTPIGVNALVFVGVYGIVLSQRRFFAGKSFAVVWLGFAVIAAGASLLSWILVSALNAALVAPRAVVFQYLVTLGVFPLLAWIFLRWQRAFLESE